MAAQQPDGGHLASRGGVIRHARIPAQREALHQPRARLDRQVVEAGEEEVRLQRKAMVGRLDEKPPPDALDLGGHALLGREAADMLDHRVREHGIERAVGELWHRAAIADQLGEVGPVARVRHGIQQCDLQRGVRRDAQDVPEELGAADVEDVQRAWHAFQ